MTDFSIQGQGNNVDPWGIGELHAFGLVVDKKDPLLENLLNIGTMNCASQARNLDQSKWTMNWDVVSKIDELELLR